MISVRLNTTVPVIMGPFSVPPPYKKGSLHITPLGTLDEIRESKLFDITAESKIQVDLSGQMLKSVSIRLHWKLILRIWHVF